MEFKTVEQKLYIIFILLKVHKHLAYGYVNAHFGPIQ
jgi:hypothetical protein